jgi:hypothetical protein
MQVDDNDGDDNVDEPNGLASFTPADLTAPTKKVRHSLANATNLSTKGKAPAGVVYIGKSST